MNANIAWIAIGTCCIAAFFAFVWYLSRRNRPAPTSLRTRVLFVLQDSYSPMSADDLATETHASIEEIRTMLQSLVGEERVRSSWDGASPYRVYSLIRN